MEWLFGPSRKKRGSLFETVNIPSIIAFHRTIFTSG